MSRLQKFDIPEDWVFKKISQISILLKDGTHGTHKSLNEGIPLLSAKDIVGNKIILDRNPRLISEEDYNSIHKNWKIEKGDILLTIVGTLGRTAIVCVESKFTFQRSVAIIRVNNQVNNKFLAYYFSSSYFQNELILRSNASAQAGVYLGELSKIEVPVPSCLKEQKKIAAILSSVDRVIETTQDAIAQLQIVKRGLMQQLLTQGIPGWHQKYKETKLGKIPIDWKVVKLNFICDFISGSTPARSKQKLYFDNGTIDWVKTGDLNEKKIKFTSEKITEIALKESSCKLIPPQSVLVAMYGGWNQIGRTGILIDWSAINQAICAILPSKYIEPESKFRYY